MGHERSLVGLAQLVVHVLDATVSERFKLGIVRHWTLLQTRAYLLELCQFTLPEAHCQNQGQQVSTRNRLRNVFVEVRIVIALIDALRCIDQKDKDVAVVEV